MEGEEKDTGAEERLQLSLDRLEHAVPANARLPMLCFVHFAEPSEGRAAHNMVLGHKTPIAAVRRTVTIVPHQPVITLLKGILGGRQTIEHDHISVHPQIVSLVCRDHPSVKHHVPRSQRDRLAGFGQVDGAVIVQVPTRKVKLVGVGYMSRVPLREVTSMG